MNSVRLMNRRPRMAAVAMAATLAVAGPASAQNSPLDQLPQGADAVFVVPDLSALSEELANLKQALNLPMPELDDALGALKQSTGMVNGVDDDGAALLVLPDLAAAMAEDREPNFLLLMPVADYNAFVANFGAQQAEGVAALTMPGGQSGFAKESGGYAVLGQSQDIVKGYTAGNAAAGVATKIGALGQTYLGEGDAYFYADLEKLGPTLTPKIQEAIDGMVQMLEQGAMGMSDPMAVNNAKAVYSLYGAAAKAVVNDSTGVLAALDLSDKGVAFTYALAFKPGSSLASTFPGNKNGDVGLAQLPEQPYIAAASIDAKAINLGQLYGQLAEAMPAEANPGMPDPKLWLPLVQKVNSLAMAFYAPNEMAMMNNALLNTISVIEVDDGPAYVGTFKSYINAMNGMEIPLPQPAAAAPADGVEGQPVEPAAPMGEPQKIVYTSSYTDKALELDGTPVDQFELRTQLPPEMINSMGPAGGFMQAFTNYTGYVAAKGNKVIVTTLPDPQLVTKGFQTMANGGGLGTAGALTKVRDEALPPNPAMQTYISVSGIAQTANTFLQMFGQPPLQAPADLPPIAAGLGIEGESVAFRQFFPLETVKFIVDTGTSFMGMMGGPGAPPEGPQGGPPPF